jgi:RNA-directed DNA polymerase
MGLGGLLRRLFSHNGGLGAEELAGRLRVPLYELQAIRPSYARFTVAKRGGGVRPIDAPDAALKAIQRRILRRLLGRLKTHPAATGFVRRESIVTNALRHVEKAVVVRMDIERFFASTRADRVSRYFRAVGWGHRPARLLTRLCTHEGGLPQGAPTSPALSNLVNYRLDARLAGLARRFDAIYTRYADDITFSFARNDPRAIHYVILLTKHIVRQHGYRLHQRRKLHIRRRHQRQVVTGLIVNDGVRLPRETRRWLRAVEHRTATGGRVSLTQAQLDGWRALCSMVERQSVRSEGA